MKRKNIQKKEEINQIALGGDELKKFLTMNDHQKGKSRVHIFINLLQTCAKRKDIYTGEQIHSDIINKKLLQKNIILGNSLINMYAKCGELAKSQEVFDKLPNRDVISWNTLIAGYVQNGWSQKALLFLEQMQHSGLSPNVVTYLSVLKACGKMRDFEKGREIHDIVSREGLLENNTLIGNALVDMYAKCGQVGKAQEVFDNLPVQNLVSWNSLIGGYSQRGCGESTFNSFEEMQLCGPPADGITLVLILKVCSSIGSLEMGQDIHAQIMQGEFLSKDIVVGNALMDMYAKCGQISKAQEVFDILPIQDLVSWNVLISGYAQYGSSETALNCFEQMQVAGFSPNVITYLSSLQACTSIGDLKKGQELHDQISRNGALAKDVSIGNALLDMYAKCDTLAKAQDTFDHLSLHNIISWNTLIAMYSEEGLGEKSLDCLEQMQLEGFSPNALTFTFILKACGNMNAAAKGHEIHAKMVKTGFLDENLMVGDALIEMYVKFRLFCEAQQVFDMLTHRDIVSWNALLAGYNLQGHGVEVLKVIQKILIDGLSPDVVTFVLLSKICETTGSIVQGQDVHSHTVRVGELEKDSVVGNALVDMYAKFHMLAEAQEMFDRLTVHGIISWNALIVEYLQQGNGNEALDCYERMQLGGSFPDTFTLLCSVRACSIVQISSKGNEIYSTIIKKGLMENGEDFGTALVDMYAKCGDFDAAEEVLVRFSGENVATWNALIRGCNERGNYDKALGSFDWMQFLGLSPDSVTFISILKACGNIGSLKKGQLVHDVIAKESFEKDMLICNAIVHMYAKCGALVPAQEVFDNISFPDIVTWNTLLGGYVQYGYAKEVLHCFQQMQLCSISPNDTSFICCLKACGSGRIAVRGKQVHAITSTWPIGIHVTSCSTLVNMYAKCGHFREAQEMLDQLSVKDLVSWTMLIAGYAENGHGEEALTCFGQMQQEGILPDVVSFICSLKACTIIESLDKGKKIHCQVKIDGLLEKDIGVGNTLLDMYAKCGAFVKAQEVFSELQLQDMVSWNILIAGYVQQGHIEEAVKFFHRMQLMAICPDIVTFLSILRACGTIGTLEKGKQIHAQIHMIRDENLEKDISVGNALLDMYAKCGAIANAQELFEKIPIPTTVSWNALISGYAQYGHHEEALDCFEKMQLAGFASDVVTFISILKVCGNQGAVTKGQDIHFKVVNQGLLEEFDIIGNSIVDMYAKCGWIIEAQDMFWRLPNVDIVSWNTLIAGYTQHGYGSEAVSCYKQMYLWGFIPDAITYLYTLKAFSVMGIYDTNHDIHSQIIKDGWLQKNILLGSVLVDMYAKCGNLSRAKEVFNELPTWNAASVNALIAGYARHGNDVEALSFFHEMQLHGIFPDSVTYICILKTCGSIGMNIIGQTIHSQFTTGGLLEGSNILSNAVIDMYSKCGMLDEAQNVFDKLYGLGAVSWNVLISGYAQLGRNDEVSTLLDKFLSQDNEPNPMTFTILLNICSHTGLLQESNRCLETMVACYGIIPTLEHYGCVVDLLGRAGRLDEANTVISKMPFIINLSVWNSLFGACQKQGCTKLGRLMFSHIIELDKDHAAAYVGLGNIYATDLGRDV